MYWALLIVLVGNNNHADESLKESMMNTTILVFLLTLVAYAALYIFKPLKLIKNGKVRFATDAGLHLLAILCFLYIGLEPKHSPMIVFAVLGVWILYKKIADYLKLKKEFHR